MHKNRYLNKSIARTISEYPVTAILGSRQVGKSTLAKEIIKDFENSLYLDLELPSDLNKLNNPELFFETNQNKLICLDEIQRKPEIFSVIRSVVDNKDFKIKLLVLGSASRDLIKQSSETLAGRISYIELTPFNLLEVEQENRLLIRGGYPRSYLSEDDHISFRWRIDFIRTYLERDIPALELNLPTKPIERLWRMCAHSQGQLANYSKLASSLGVSSVTVKKYLDVINQTFIIRYLEPYFLNSKKRIVKSPKMYIRDSGLCNCLLGLENYNDLLGHPNFGQIYEGFVIENILSSITNYDAAFYRDSNKNEIDLVLKYKGKLYAIEVKASKSPKLNKGFYSSIDEVKPDLIYVIAPVNDPYQLESDITVSNISEFIRNLTLKTV